ncbi:MAG: prepilin-type N-terminal cleavage/methylation domain-containing protein, partial [Desulfohalobiaceae bacterium]|nr:prepilin-type N-terminal cleavage/methylation domain-containing protein [Desulfohalobiaceae bacterium]
MMPLRDHLEKIRPGKGPEQEQGFTFVELALVLVVMGLLLFLGDGAWLSLKESREVAKTRSSLQQIRNCLMGRM